MNQTEPFNVAAYGGGSWSPRHRSLSAEIGDLWAQCGINSEWAPLKAVLLHRPGVELTASSDPDAVQMLEQVDLAIAQQQHDAITAAYRAADVQVHYVEPVGTPHPNQMFVADLMFMTPEGAIVARPASTVRAGEERWVARRLADLGVPIIRTVRGRGTFEGADAAWLNPQTVLLGRGLRTNEAGAMQVSNTLNEMGVDVVQIDLPYGTMHMMGMLRFADRDLAIAWPKRLVHRGIDALKEHGYEVAFLPDLEEPAHKSAFNFVTLGPRKILMGDNCPNTEAFYKSLGIHCVQVPIDELRKAAGAIGCLTGVVARETIY